MLSAKLVLLAAWSSSNGVAAFGALHAAPPLARHRRLPKEVQEAKLLSLGRQVRQQSCTHFRLRTQTP